MADQDETFRQPPAPPAPAAPPASPVPPVAPASPAVRSTSRPPTRRARLLPWFSLLACLALAAPGLLIDLHQPDVTRKSEAYSLLMARDTLEHFRQERGEDSFWFDAWAPFVNGQPQWQAPPGLSWVYLAALGGTDTGLDRLPSLIARARLVSVLMAMIALAAVFWAGHSIGGARTGLIAGLVYATSPVFLLLSRRAEPPIFDAGWALLSIAAALWALRPLRPPPTVARQAIGWAICGLTMGVTILTAGPGALIAVVLPIALMTWLCPNRTNHLLGLLAAVLIAGLTFLPWAAFAHYHDADAWPPDWIQWVPLDWFNPAKLLVTVAEGRAGLMIAALLPWALWLVGAMVQPFSTSSLGVRTRLFLGWGWFIMEVVFLFATPDGRDACLLAAAAAGAVLIAEVFSQYVDLAAHGKPTRIWRWTRLPHLALLVFASLAVVFVLGLHPWIEPMGLPGRPALADMGRLFPAVLCVALLVLVGLSVRWTLRNFPANALAFWAIWAAVLLTGMMMAIARSDAMKSPVRDEGQHLAHLVNNTPLYWWGGLKTDPAVNNPALLLYSGKTSSTLLLDRMKSVWEDHPLFYLVCSQAGPQLTPTNGVEYVETLHGARLLLYRCRAPASETRPAPTSHPATAP